MIAERPEQQGRPGRGGSEKLRQTTVRLDAEVTNFLGATLEILREEHPDKEITESDFVRDAIVSKLARLAETNPRVAAARDRILAESIARKTARIHRELGIRPDSS